MNIFIVIAIALVLVFIDMSQAKAINNKLSNFVGFKAKAQWIEQRSNGETYHYTKWNTCSAIIAEKHNVYYYITQPVCYK